MTNNTEIEHIEIISDHTVAERWRPAFGEETHRLMDHLSLDLNDDTELQRIRQAAASTLGKCTHPNQPGRTTGLVLGQIQSGKTMSFTMLAAIARDNGYRLVIVITGTSVSLLNQSVERLRNDLGIESGNRGWRHLPIEHAGMPDISAITSALDEWRDPEVPSRERRTLLITILKQHRNLMRLTDALRQINLEDVPTLIIDDEADQASLNSQVLNDDQSTTYRRLLELRDAVPRHAFVQYTATPQALMLINIIDVLSPRFIEVLDAGNGYCGGYDFFERNRAHVIHEIPVAELPTRQQPLQEPPASFFEALRLFFIGVSAGICRGEQGNRSMMIHPSRTTDEHMVYQHWVEQTKIEWGQLLSLPNGDRSKEELLDEFRQAVANLRITEPDLPSDDELLGHPLRFAVRRSLIQVLNARGGRTPRINWGGEYSLILIGGTVLDRGFTIKGLTVTYMPRSLGGGVADTLQQRARFFGYRASYFGLCRVFLPRDVIDAFRAYVEHEFDLRGRLRNFERTGQPLTEWPRLFILDSNLKPTRDSLIDIAYQRGMIGNDWSWTRSPHITTESSMRNAQIIREFINSTTFVNDEGHPDRTEYQRHHVAEIDLRTVLNDLLVKLQFSNIEDSLQYTAILSLLSRILEGDPNVMSTTYYMSGGINRIRRVGSNDRLGGASTLFQGAHPSEKGPRRGSIYPGDASIRAQTGVTVQIHILTIIRESGERLENVPAIAIWIPDDMARPILIQPQGGV